MPEVHLKFNEAAYNELTWDAMIALGKAGAGEPIGYEELKEVVIAFMTDENGTPLPEDVARKRAGRFKASQTETIFSELMKAVADFLSAKQSGRPSMPAPTASAEAAEAPAGLTPSL